MAHWQGRPPDGVIHSDSCRAFFDCLEERLTPILRADGFRGSRKTFRRVRGEVVHVIQPQPSSRGDRCAVNLGLHLTFLPIYDGSFPDAQRISETACEFRRRLAPEGEADYWWLYGSSPAETEASVRSMIQAYETIGRKHFETIGEFPGIYATIAPDELSIRDRNPLFGTQPPVRLARSLALVALYLGQIERARSFAEFGLVWDRGADVAALDDEVQAIVDFLA